MTALKTRIARNGRTAAPVRPVTGGVVPAAVDSPAFKYSTGASGAELAPLTPLITSDGAIIPGEGPGAPDHVIPAGRR